MPLRFPTLVRRLGGCAVALALTLAVAPTPAVSAQQGSGPGSSARTTTKARRSAKSSTKSSTKSSRKSSTRTRTSATRASSRPAPAAPLPSPVPDLPPIDLAALAPLAGAPLAAAAPAAPEAAPPAELPKPFAAFSQSASSLLDALTERARSQLGTRYVLGGTSPGGALDCSAFTRFAMEALGLRLPRTAAQQAKVGVAVPRDRERLRPGDLLTFGRGRRVSHVGIYLGEGRFIHASVKSGQVIETTFAKNALLLRRWLGARRLLANADSTPPTGG